MFLIIIAIFYCPLIMHKSSILLIFGLDKPAIKENQRLFAKKIRSIADNRLIKCGLICLIKPYSCFINPIMGIYTLDVLAVRRNNLFEKTPQFLPDANIFVSYLFSAIKDTNK